MDKTNERHEFAAARKPAFWLICGGVTVLLGLLSPSYGLLFFCCLALGTAMQAVLYAAGRSYLCFLFAMPALALAYLMGGVAALFPVAGCTVAALVLSHRAKRGEGRVSLMAGVFAVYAVTLLAALLMQLVSLMMASGESDLLAYTDRAAGELLAGMVDWYAAQTAKMAAFYEKAGVLVMMPTKEVIREVLLGYAALLPAIFLIVCAALAFGATYLLQLLGLLMEDEQVFSAENRVYRVSPVVAGAYLLALPVGFLFVDIRDPLCLCCRNLAVLLAPLLAYGAILQAPRLIAFMRRMSAGRLDFVFFLVLFVLFLLANFVYALFILAAAYAIYILKSAITARRKRETR